MAFLDTLAGELLGTKSINTLSKASGANASQVQQVVTAALPMLLSAMNDNAATEDGAAALGQALDKHAGNAKTSTSAMLKEADAEDGKKVVKHVLGDKTNDITKGLAKKTGLSAAQITTILATLAPVVLSLLGSQKSDTAASSSSTDLTSLLTGALLGGNANTSGSSLNLAAVAGALLGGDSTGSANSGASALGGLLGGLLGGGNESGGSSAAALAGGLIGNLLGGSTGSAKQDNTSDALSSLLGSLLK